MDFQYTIKRPRDCTNEEITAFLALAKQSDYIQAKQSLESRVSRAHLLSFCYLDGKAVSICALKNPTNKRKEYLFNKAKAPELKDDYIYEAGWLYVLPDYRGNNIGKNMLERLFSKASPSSAFGAARTRNIHSMATVDKAGFQKLGIPFLNSSGEYYVSLIGISF